MMQLLCNYKFSKQFSHFQHVLRNRWPIFVFFVQWTHDNIILSQIRVYPATCVVYGFSHFKIFDMFKIEVLRSDLQLFVI